MSKVPALYEGALLGGEMEGGRWTIRKEAKIDSIKCNEGGKKNQQCGGAGGW